MTKSLNPNEFLRNFDPTTKRWAQSVHDTVNGQLDQGRATGSVDSTGNYNDFTQGNSNGSLIRVGASGTSGNQYTWDSSNTAITVYHGLVDSSNNPRKPIGVHVVNKDKTVDVFMATAPNTTSAQVTPTDHTANVTLYFF